MASLCWKPYVFKVSHFRVIHWPRGPKSLFFIPYNIFRNRLVIWSYQIILVSGMYLKVYMNYNTVKTACRETGQFQTYRFEKAMEWKVFYCSSLWYNLISIYVKPAILQISTILYTIYNSLHTNTQTDTQSSETPWDIHWTVVVCFGSSENQASGIPIYSDYALDKVLSRCRILRGEVVF